MSLFYFDILYREDFDKCRPPDSMVGHLFQNYDTTHLSTSRLNVENVKLMKLGVIRLKTQNNMNFQPE